MKDPGLVDLCAGETDLSPGELELCLLRTELRALVKRWRFNLSQGISSQAERNRNKKELIELMCKQVETILEGGR